MTPDDRACLNRRAAELAGWTFAPAETEQGPGVEIVSPAGTRMLAWDGRGADFCAPNLMGSPALWWTLVERMVSLTDWQGPLCSQPARTCGEVHYPASWVVMVGGETYVAEEPGVAVCVAAVGVAAVLGLGAAE